MSGKSDPQPDHREFTDPLGQRPKFLGEFHSLVARAVNTYYGEKSA